MEGYVEWGNVAPQEDKKTGKINYLWLRGGNKYRIRPVHKAVHFFKYFYRNEGRMRTAVCADPDTCPVLSAHSDLKPASSRYAIYVIDRENEDLKVMEGPKTVFVPFRKKYEVTNKDPGGSTTGGDWEIEVTGSGKDGTAYTVTYIENTPLTKEEKEMITEKMEDENARLINIYKVNTPEEIEKRLFEPWQKKSSEANFEPDENLSLDQEKSSTDTSQSSDEENMDW